MTENIRTFSSDEALVRERRSRIVECAIKVFYEKGYRGTTTKELAQACGMAQGALYHYIGSKDDVLHLICINRSSGSASLKELLGGLGSVTKTEALCTCMERYFRTNDVEAYEMTFFSREIGNFSHEDRHMLLQSQVDIQKFFEDLLNEGIRSGEFQLDSPALVAHNILMMGHDWALRKWFLKTLFTQQEYTEREIQFVLDAIAARSDGHGDGRNRKEKMAVKEHISS